MLTWFVGSLVGAARRLVKVYLSLRENLKGKKTFKKKRPKNKVKNKKSYIIDNLNSSEKKKEAQEYRDR